jgi:DNA-binding response OmpR family regulator
MKKDILLVEDDLMLGQVLTDYLHSNNLSVCWAKDGITGLKYYNELHPKLLILDVMLPDITGLELLEELKKANVRVPVIFMTGTEFSVESQVKAYNLGAINYLKKPVIPEVLLAQINQLIQTNELKNYQYEQTFISIDKQLLTINEKIIKLREKEAQLLIFLLENKNRLVSRNEILQYLWCDNHPKRNSQLDSIISRLKKELAEIPSIKIDAIYGVGYTVLVK